MRDWEEFFGSSFNCRIFLADEEGHDLRVEALRPKAGPNGVAISLLRAHTAKDDGRLDAFLSILGNRTPASAASPTAQPS